MNLPFEPFKCKVVEPIPITTGEHRAEALRRAGYNLFHLRSADVSIDLLTDSGTGAMSQEQWGALLRGDEAYAGAESFYRFEKVVRLLTGYPEVIPTHQGRAAEHLLFRLLGGRGKIVLSNTLFDTTRAHVQASGATGVDLLCPEGFDLRSSHPFKGNLDLSRLQSTLQTVGPQRVGAVVVTVTNNSAAGQPVSMTNLRATSAFCREWQVPFFIDACRFAENAYFIQQREERYSRMSPRDIGREMFSLADGCTMSAKKDGLANIGGFLALRDRQLASKAKELLVLYEGFHTYGGLAGRDLEAIAVGLEEALQETYLSDRIASVAFLGEELKRRGVPVVLPFGGHAVYMDATAFLDHLRPEAYPGQALACALYLDGGIRACEIGSVMFGIEGRSLPVDLVRLAVPRRVYSRHQLAYVADVAGRLLERRKTLSGVEMIHRPDVLPHFGARFRPLAGEAIPAPRSLTPSRPKG